MKEDKQPQQEWKKRFAEICKPDHYNHLVKVEPKIRQFISKLLKEEREKAFGTGLDMTEGVLGTIENVRQNVRQQVKDNLKKEIEGMITTQYAPNKTEYINKDDVIKKL